MKTYYVVAALSALYGVQANNMSTVVCPNCPPQSSTNDIVTREPVPSTPCTAPELTTVPTNPDSTTHGMVMPTGGNDMPTGGNGHDMPTGGNGSPPAGNPTESNYQPPMGNPTGGNPPAPTGGMETSVVPGTGGTPSPTGSNPPPVVGGSNMLTGSVFAAVVVAAAACMV